MKLTKDMRKSFIRAVMADVTDGGKTEALENAIVDYAVMLMPPELRAVWRAGTQYRGFFNQQNVLLYASDSGEYGDCDYRAYAGVCAPVDRFDHAKLAPRYLLENAEVKYTWSVWKEWYLERAALESRLEVIAEQCTTVEKLLKALPELEKYMPDAPPPMTNGVPQTADVAIMLTNLGLPK